MATNENNPCTCTTPEYTIILNQQGPSGRQGATGQNGFSPTIEVVNNDYSNYQLRVTNATSSFTTPNLKANLPSGGSTGQILTKNSDTNGDYVWSNISSEQLPNNILLNNKPLQILNKASIITDQSLNSYIAAIDGIEDESGYCNGAILTPNGLTLANFSSDGILIAEQGFGLTTKNIQAGENIFFSYTEDNPQKLVISGTAAPYTLPQASTTTLGGIKVGDGLSITDDGVLSASGEQLPNNILLNNKPLQILNKASIITDQSLNSYIAAIDGIEDESGYCNGAILTPNGLTLANFSSDGILIAEQGFGLTTKNIQAGENIFFSYTEDNPQKLVISGTAAPYTLPQASTTTLGGIKVGDGLSITDDGVLSASGGLRYKTLTSTEYEALSTKDADTMYRLTDTNEVYLGTIPLTGGANAQYKTLLINNYDNATQTNLGGSTTVQVTDTEV